MKPLVRGDVEQIYSNLVLSAEKNYRKGRFEKALCDIEVAAHWEYNFNDRYTDEGLESLLTRISSAVVKEKTIKYPSFQKCVVIDSWCLDNRGLTQQYIRAIMANKMDLLYVCTNDAIKKGDDILTELRNYDKAEVLLFTQEKKNRINKAKVISERIEKFGAGHLFLHLTPFDTAALVAVKSVLGSIIYNINLTDHAFWLGTSVIDYNLEFRPYGRTVSSEKRGIEDKKLIALPYYPVSPINHDFHGFPEMPSDAVKLLTGGALYKMLGKNDMFFKIMERIIMISPKIYILVAGFDHSDIFEEKIRHIKGNDRIKIIGARRDINACFENSDIYLSTYPLMGGLMSQYAAIHGRPIIAYYDEHEDQNAVEEVVNLFQNDFHSFMNLDDLTDYAAKLINNVEFRVKEGQKLKDGMMTSERFNESFLNIITHHCSLFNWEKDTIDYDSFFERYLNLENTGGFNASKMVVAKLKFRLFSTIRTKRMNFYKLFFQAVLDKVRLVK